MDPISDMFIRIKNARRAGHDSLQISYSKFKYEILKVLDRSGFISEINRKGKRTKRFLEIKFSQKNKDFFMHNVRLISKPSRRLYTPYKDIRKSIYGGVIIISTPKGVLSSEEARKEKVGGEIIAEVW